MLRLDTKTRELAARARFGFNAVGGYSAQTMLRLLQPNASSVMITYGGMSKQPLVVPTGAFIFKDITLRGFWLTRWLERDERTTQGEGRRDMLHRVSTAVRDGVLRVPLGTPARRPPRQPSRRASPRRHGGRRRPHHPHPRSQKNSRSSLTARRASSFPLDSPLVARGDERMAYLIDSHTVYPHANARRHSQGWPTSARARPAVRRHISSRGRRIRARAFAFARARTKAPPSPRRRRPQSRPRASTRRVRRDETRRSSERGFEGFARVRAGAREMCGIFSVLRLTGDARKNRQRVYQLAKRLRHRGPDSYGMEVRVDDEGRQTFMVHKRGTSWHWGKSGDQPLFTDASKKTAFIANGEIYNHAELREKYGIVSENKSDCQVIGHLSVPSNTDEELCVRVGRYVCVCDRGSRERCHRGGERSYG